MNSICYAVYRCFSLNCNYAKGVGEDFQYWRNINHPGSLLVALSRLSGSREDAILEGATAIFWNRWMYIAYLEELLGTPGCDNLLFDNMAIILRSEEICALCRVCAILHYSISMPMRWLAAKTQALAEYNWSIRSMGRAIDLVFTAVRKIKDDGSLLLNSDFMNSIFDVLRTELPPFDEFLKHIFEERRSKISREGDVNSHITHSLVRNELFNPVRKENIDTKELVTTLAVEVAQVMIKEFCDPNKVTKDLVSDIGGKFSWKNTTPEEHEAGKGKSSTNDAAESPFGSLSHVLQTHGRLNPENAAAIATAVFNGDFIRSDIDKCQKQVPKHPTEEGSFISLPHELAQSLLQVGFSQTKPASKRTKERVTAQKANKKEKQVVLQKAGIERAQKKYIEKLHYHHLYQSDECWNTVDEVDRGLARLSDSQKLKAVKEQIKMRSIGLEHMELHHAWTRNRVAYTWQELATHLKDVCIPAQQGIDVPTNPQPQMPIRKLPQLGKLASDVAAINEAREKATVDFIDEAKLKKDEKYAGDLIEKSLEELPKTDELLGRRIAKMFEFEEPCGKKQNDWCVGEVVAVKSLRTQTVHVEWDKQYLRPGEPTVQEEKLLKSKYNKSSDGGWIVLDEEDHDEADETNIFSDVEAM